MLLTIDIGNSNIVLAVYNKQKERLYDARFETLKEKPEETYPQWITEHLLPLKDRYGLEDFILSSVVPAVTSVFFESTRTILGLSGVNCTLDLLPGFEVKLDNPRELGADFIGTSIAALSKSAPPIIIADLGSATKISALDPNGAFAGGVIMPGLKISQDALNRFIPHLPVIPMEIPDSPLGHDTITAMQAGMMFSNIDAVRGIANRIEAAFGQKCTRILTGGLSHLIHTALPEFTFEPFLLNEGLFEIYRRNRS